MRKWGKIGYVGTPVYFHTTLITESDVKKGGRKKKEKRER